jgi:hypothetical protein
MIINNAISKFVIFGHNIFNNSLICYFKFKNNYCIECIDEDNYKFKINEKEVKCDSIITFIEFIIKYERLKADTYKEFIYMIENFEGYYDFNVLGYRR